MNVNDEAALTASIKLKLKAAGEIIWQRYPLPWTHPSFKSCDKAALRLMAAIGDAKAVLVMRDSCLRPVRELVLKSGLKLIVPLRYATDVALIPSSAVKCGALRLDPLPEGSEPYTGDVDVVVVACLAFNKSEKRLYTYEMERTAYAFEELKTGLQSGFKLSADVPVVAVCADEQEVEGWPSEAQGFVKADAVFTPTRDIVLGS
jgi:5-formyltetrahydrofolate cyclo-ligase